MDDIEILDLSDDGERQNNMINHVENDNTNNSFSVLEMYGEDLSAKQYITNPAIARDEEIKNMMLALLLPEKSAIIVGKPGIGKTALAEGLAYKIQKGEVPEALKNYKVIKINVSSLLGSTTIDGNTDTKLQLLVAELKGKQDTILFIDEIHTIIGTGSEGGSIDFAQMLKPGLDRGSIKLIGATTTQEFERYLISDRALLRRFEKIDLEEPTQEVTVEILMGSLPKIEHQTGVKLDYNSFIIKKIITFIVNMTSEYKRVHSFISSYPDIPLTLLSKAFSYALYDNSEKVTFKHIWKAISNFKGVYPDVIEKEQKVFKEEFKDYLEEEIVDLSDNI
ncbi:MAG: AAA family ATPase [Bacilli bacterium]|nr:AAA family ATPase [Bacilli bacterium]